LLKVNSREAGMLENLLANSKLISTF